MKKLYIGLLRISIGSIFLWAFFDKLLGLGFATLSERAWIVGGSPTTGYLMNAPKGPFANVYQGLAGNPLIDYLFMLGLLGVGLAFVLGIALRFASLAGATMMVLMYLSVFPPANNPIIDEHIIYALVLLVLAALNAGEEMGFAKQWSKSKIVKLLPFLKN